MLPGPFDTDWSSCELNAPCRCRGEELAASAIWYEDLRKALRDLVGLPFTLRSVFNSADSIQLVVRSNLYMSFVRENSVSSPRLRVVVRTRVTFPSSLRALRLKGIQIIDCMTSLIIAVTMLPSTYATISKSTTRSRTYDSLIAEEAFIG